MKLLKIGFVAALALALHGQAMAAAPAATKLDPKAQAQGMKEAPAVVQQAGLDCSVSDAYFMGAGEDKVDGKPVKTNIYEVACGTGLGYIIVSKGPAAPPEAYDCLTMQEAASRADPKKKGGLVCTLPGNADPKQGLAPLVVKAGGACTLNNARQVGASAASKIVRYEVGCSEGRGYFMDVPQPGSTKPLSLIDCTKAKVLAGTECTFTTAEQISQAIVRASAAAGKTACQASAGRWVVTDPSKGDEYYEIGCADGKSGYMFVTNAKGAYQSTIDCARASGIAGGCTLTNVEVAESQEAGTYTKLATQIGYPCTVTKYHSMGIDKVSGREVVELVCTEHPESIWAMVPTGAGQTGEYFNCIRATEHGLACKLSPPEATYAKISSQIAARGKTTCQVHDARALGRTAEGTDFIEVACTGGPGLMLEYSKLPAETLISALPCKDAAGIAGGCKLK